MKMLLLERPMWIIDSDMTARNYFKIYLEPAFLICAVVLALAGATMPKMINSFGGIMKKEPLPLKKSLVLLDANGLGSYKVVSKTQIENEDILKTLGTEDYIQWTLEDTNAPSDSSTRYCMLFITYYGKPDKVPHVPEVCYVGAGNNQVESDEVTLKLNIDGKERQIPGKYLVFMSSQTNQYQPGSKFPMMYNFSVNGEYGCSRKDVRIGLNKNIFGKYSYFSKVEWKFYNLRLGMVCYPDKKETIAASAKMLNVILPILEKEHWPSLKDIPVK